MGQSKIDIQYQCGCGYKSISASEAVKHAETKHHSLTILGRITVPKPKKEK
jgi:hypothetical protein